MYCMYPYIYETVRKYGYPLEYNTPIFFVHKTIPFSLLLSD